MSNGAVLDDLSKVVDDRVRPATSTDAIDGVLPAYVAVPSCTEQTAEVLRVAAQNGLHVVARGAGTKQDWAFPPDQVDLVIDTTAMSGVVEHAAGDLITIVRAGTLLTELRSTLAGADQELALDSAFPSATVGGTVAANISGPRRVRYGTLRDLLIGITFVRADGVIAKAGGKVVKNVAGYDFGKLLTGSFGTLGVITEVALRLHPLPRTRRAVTVEMPDGELAAQAALRVLRSQVVPSAVEVSQPADGAPSVLALIEGVEAGVGARVETTQTLLGPTSEIGELPDSFGRYPFEPGDIGFKISTTLSGVGPVLTAARGLGQRLGAPISVRGSAAGVLYAALPAGTDPAATGQVLAELRTVAASFDGTVVVLTGPAPTRRMLDVWGPVSGLDLMKRLKDQLDPEHRLAPGRFVGGI
ncbi:MAG: FAD-binding oxidoreductase [Actinomycetota bacterium]|nr:FAD-binding oxidoreductase [Actinomycetota bacterium]